MNTAVAILGLNGSGKSTLAHALALATGYREMDAEDYYFPTQRASRQLALAHQPDPHADARMLPFSSPQGREEACVMLMRDAIAHPHLILASVDLIWCAPIIPRIALAFVVSAPLDERLRRVAERERACFGTRVEAGGDLYAISRAFRQKIASRGQTALPGGADALQCPVMYLDGMASVKDNVEIVLQQMSAHALPLLPANENTDDRRK